MKSLTMTFALLVAISLFTVPSSTLLADDGDTNPAYSSATKADSGGYFSGFLTKVKKAVKNVGHKIKDRIDRYFGDNKKSPEQEATEETTQETAEKADTGLAKQDSQSGAPSKKAATDTKAPVPDAADATASKGATKTAARDTKKSTVAIVQQKAAPKKLQKQNTSLKSHPRQAMSSKQKNPELERILGLSPDTLTAPAKPSLPMSTRELSPIDLLTLKPAKRYSDSPDKPSGMDLRQVDTGLPPSEPGTMDFANVSVKQFPKVEPISSISRSMKSRTMPSKPTVKLTKLDTRKVSVIDLTGAFRKFAAPSTPSTPKFEIVLGKTAPVPPAVKIKPVPKVKYRKLLPWTDNDHNFAIAVITLLENGNKLAALGHFDNLSRKFETESDRLKSLYFKGYTLAELNANSFAFDTLVEMIKKAKKSPAKSPYVKNAADLAVKVAGPYNRAEISNLNIGKLLKKEQESYRITRARSLLPSKNDKSIPSLLKAINKPTSKHYSEARFLEGLYYTKKKDYKKALASFKATAKGSSMTPELSQLVAMNISRLLTQTDNLKSALKQYSAIGKNNNLWLDSMVERGWVQLKLNNNIKAVEQMHPLHTSLFKTAFIPDSYLIRSVGYFRICHFPEAYKTLKFFEYKYTPFYRQMMKLSKNKDAGQQIYKNIGLALSKGKRGSSLALPYPVLLELARQMEFVNLQNGINSYARENKLLDSERKSLKKSVGKNSTVLSHMKAQDERCQKELAALKATVSDQEVAAMKSKCSHAKLAILRSEREAEFLKISEALVVASLQKLKTLATTKSRALLARNHSFLKSHFDGMLADLQSSMQTKDLLKIEILGGASKNLQRQVMSASRKQLQQLENKSQGKNGEIIWPFEGEFWEDELEDYNADINDACIRNRQSASI